MAVFQEISITDRRENFRVVIVTRWTYNQVN